MFELVAEIPLGGRLQALTRKSLEDYLRVVKKTPSKRLPKADESLEESYRTFFHEQVSPLWVDEENSDYSLEQPSPLKIVPSVTTYGISEAPIVR